MASLSTHVLDTARGKPAAGLEINLYAIEGAERRLLKTVKTNANGRTDEPLLSGDAMETGIYELVFAAGAYLRSQQESLPNPPFLDQVVIRFGVADARGHYHVPLLLSAYGYSTYRGS